MNRQALQNIFSSLLVIFISTLGGYHCSTCSAADPLRPLGDEFENSATTSGWLRNYQTEGWDFDQLEEWDINTTQPGRMHMMPYTVTWYQDYRGVLAYKEVTGDFIIETTVHVTDRDLDDGDDFPNNNFSLAGLLVRSPKDLTTGADGWVAGQENYIFLSLGRADNKNNNTFEYELKNTINSQSFLSISNAAESTTTLRFARIGSNVITMYREPGAEWQVLGRFNRPDFPDTLQVGFNTYTDYSTVSQYGYLEHNSTLLDDPSFNPDIITSFDYARFATPEVPPELQGLNLSNSNTVSDEQLLAFLGTEDAVLPAVAGDMDGDGLVDRTDLRELLHQYGNIGQQPFSGSDLNGDGLVGLGDLSTLSAIMKNQHDTLAPPPANAVPEPSTLVLVLLLGITLSLAHVSGARYIFQSSKKN